MRTYAMSDVHGCLEAFETRIAQLADQGFFEDGCEDVLVLLGDYVDRGPDSLGVVREAMRLQRECPGRVVALMGNHEDDLLHWLGAAEWDKGTFPDVPLSGSDQRGLLNRLTSRFRSTSTHASLERLQMWRAVDPSGLTMLSFLGPVAYAQLESAIDLNDAYAAKAFERACISIRSAHAAEITWLRNLPLHHETDRQVFVHAGINESQGESWQAATSCDTMLRTRATPHGPFAKDIIAGHTPKSTISGDPAFHGVLQQGPSHYYLDGATYLSATIPVLMYDSASATYQEFDERGELQPIK